MSDFTFTFHFSALEKEMATHSSVLAWRIPGMGSLLGGRLWDRTELDTTERLGSSSSPVGSATTPGPRRDGNVDRTHRGQLSGRAA